MGLLIGIKADLYSIIELSKCDIIGCFWGRRKKKVFVALTLGHLTASTQQHKKCLKLGAK